ncbi:glycosyl transferase group 1 protein [Neobacillus bataviensis LMG 21833]|uniref:Glycosyl transferase group 1 protein n=1 Tax=Neobacillus bataviensis LMG 21833 TaxID=1117379 RepID=K6E024_9BACI|nr:glycosyltransferase family 4 protein [Neobacillus bataviensis]EKN66476.1 glycosyl transferase group 1 protein [Neobacillus bataviensis LMG 21833]
MKRVLIISQQFYPEIGSHANRIKHLYTQLGKHDFDVTVLTTEPSYPNKKIYQNEEFWDEESLNHDPTHIKRIKISSRKYSNRILNRLFYYLEIAFKFIWLILRDKQKYDYVFVTSPPIFTGLVGLFAKYRYKTKLILDIRDLWPESLKGVGVFDHDLILKFFGALETILYKKSDKIVINSMGFKEYIQRKAGIQDTKLLFIPNGVVKEELAPMKRKKGTRKLIYAGNLGLAQNTEIIHQLVPLLAERDIQLTIIGYGVHRKQLVDSIKSYKNVKFIKPMTKKQCFTIIAEHDVGLVTLKDKEVFKTVLPGKMIDYMTCGVPILGVVDGYSKDLINNEGVGIAINNSDPQQIVAQLVKLLDNDQVRTQMSRKAQELILNEFNWEINIASLVEYMSGTKYPQQRKDAEDGEKSVHVRMESLHKRC